MTEPAEDRVTSTSATKSRRVAKTRAIRNVVLIACGVISLGIGLVRLVNQAREAARNSQCQGRMNQLTFALFNYHETYKCFPPAFIPDENGKPMHSWRVLILPFLDLKKEYNEYDFSEPWDGPNNRKLADKVDMHWFQCASGPNYETSLTTDYVVVVGPGTAFPGSQSTSAKDFRDGLENSILLVEIANSNIQWMEPRDLNFDKMSFVVNDFQRPSISSPHPCGPAVVFADGIRAYRLAPSLRAETLKALTTIAGHEPVTKDKLLRPDEKCYRRLAE